MSADAAKEAFDAIKEHLAVTGQKTESSDTIVIATVEGDIHDIGKNIVKVLLSNYGFNVIDLGKDVKCEKVLEAAVENECRLVALSALMTTTVVNMEKTEMTIRYAEILLIYAEALNELSEGEVYHLKTYSNEDVEIKRDEDEMRYAIKRIRMRAGVPDYTNETYKNQADFRVKLKRERQVELLGENSMRYFDLRRWKDALTEENQLLQGCNINISDDDTYIADFYKETPVS